jgi:hypothetical protein
MAPFRNRSLIQSRQLPTSRLDRLGFSHLGYSSLEDLGYSHSEYNRSGYGLSDRSYSRSQLTQSANPPNRSATKPRLQPDPNHPLLGLTLAPDSDSGILGDAKTRLATVELLGLTSANRTVSLRDSVGNRWVTKADANGQFLFANLPLAATTQFTAQVTASTGNVSYTTTVQRVSADSENVVLTWNAVALNTLRRDRAGSLEASRSLAILQGAVFDAVNAIAGSGSGYRPLPNALPELPSGPTSASAQTAAVGAAHRVLTQLYPNQTTQLDQSLAQSLSQIQETDSAERVGLQVGVAIADQLLLERSRDRSLATVVYQPTIQPGQWRPTPPRFLPAAAAHWSQVTPFVLKRAAQFRPDAPAPLTSRAYAQDLNQVKRLGQIDSPTRSPDQTATARFWLGNAGSLTFPGMWNAVAAQAVSRAPDQSNSQTLLQQARLFAQLNFALADAGIAAWDTKYTYRTWRPVTAIRLAGADNNPLTQADRSWQSFLETPAHPDYVSAHSTYSGAAAAILKQFDALSPTLSFTSLDLPSQRSFRSFAQAATSAGLSRIYGGIHTRAANRSGLKLGQEIGNYVLQQFR